VATGAQANSDATSQAAAAEAQLWRLVWRAGDVDANALLQLMAIPGVAETTDPRTSLLIRDGLRALESRWGAGPFRARMRLMRAPDSLLSHLQNPDTRGFPSLMERTVDVTDPEAVLQMLRDLGRQVRRPARLVIGGSVALILDALIIHATADVDVVDELPDVIRNDHDLLHRIAERHKLQLTHFQSHYLPDGWERRLKSLGRFGQVEVWLVDSIDMLVCKLFSRRSKDYVHLAEAWKLIDHDAFRDRLRRSTGGFRRDETSHAAGKHNWYVLTGEEDLPPLTPD
jgi:hypothetical protein